jgi:hypothetical protein
MLPATDRNAALCSIWKLQSIDIERLTSHRSPDIIKFRENLFRQYEKYHAPISVSLLTIYAVRRNWFSIRTGLSLYHFIRMEKNCLQKTSRPLSVISLTHYFVRYCSLKVDFVCRIRYRGSS